MPVHDYDHVNDRQVLRTWIATICKKEGVGSVRLLNLMTNWLSEQKWPDEHTMKIGTLKRLRDPEDKGAGFRLSNHLKGMWNFLRSKQQYVEHFYDPRTDVEERPAAFESWEHALFSSVRWFLRDEGTRFKHAHPLEELRELLSGRYLMYRTNWEPAASGRDPTDEIRVSMLEIKPSTHGILINETQDFKNMVPPHYQVNSGFLVPYGRYVVALMNGDYGDDGGKKPKESFKCMVIDKMVPVSDRLPVTEFKGRMLVSSDIGSFPSAKIICRKTSEEGKLPPLHGVYATNAIDKEVCNFLATPTFPEKYKIVS